MPTYNTCNIENWPEEGVQPLQINTCHIQRGRLLKEGYEKEMCILGNPILAGELFNWLHDSEEKIMLQTTIYRNTPNNINLHFALEVDADPQKHECWEQDVNYMLQMHSPDHFWNMEIMPKQEWKFATYLQIEMHEHIEPSKYELHKLLQFLDRMQIPIAIQSNFCLYWQPQKPPSSNFEDLFFCSHPPIKLKHKIRQTKHCLVVYSDTPISSLTKKHIVRGLYGRVPSQPIWTQSPIIGQKFQSPKAIFSNPKCKSVTVPMMSRHFHSMITADLDKNKTDISRESEDDIPF